MDDPKTLHRARLQSALRTTDSEERAAWSAALCRHLEESTQWKSAGTVMLFAPLRYEPDLLPLMAGGRRWVFPSMEENRIVPRAVADAGELVPGPFGIRGPDVERCPAVAAGSLDLILIPGLGFSPAGHRLGRGKGHYDRFLADVPAAVWRCGVCFGCQVTVELPRESHDIPMHSLLTENGMVDCGDTSGFRDGRSQ